MSNGYTTVEAAAAAGIDPGRLRGWQQHSFIDLGHRTPGGRFQFSARDVRVIALMALLVDHGITPAVAARHAEAVIDRIGDRGDQPLVGIFGHDPNQSPAVIPLDAMPKANALVAIPLAPIFRCAE
ncbi:MerR family transcriptional regulator [Pelagibacterium mangrovi]|uniref:MerR family transcriptional regulator n=1 Tax=Pelagibacterium mangrovi TaxID=3119828 RepID=UPI002FC6B352